MNDEWLRTLNLQLIKTIFSNIYSDYLNGFIKDDIKEIVREWHISKI